MANLTPASLNHLAAAAGGIAVVATATAPPVAVIGAAQTLFGVAAAFRDEARHDAQGAAALKRYRRAIRDNWRVWAGHEDAAEPAIADFNAFFADHAPDLSLSPETVAAMRTGVTADDSGDVDGVTATRLAHALLVAAEGRAPHLYADTPERAPSRRFFKAVVAGAVRHLLATDAYRRTLLLPMLDRAAGAALRTETKVDDLSKRVDEILATVMAQGETAAA